MVSSSDGKEMNKWKRDAQIEENEKNEGRK
jgi:hypothetical protein